MTVSAFSLVIPVQLNTSIIIVILFLYFVEQINVMVMMMVVRRIFRAQISPKSVFGRGSAPDPVGGAYDAPPDPLVSWGGVTPSSFPSPRGLRRLHLGALGSQL